jgi:hypothetical protein
VVVVSFVPENTFEERSMTHSNSPLSLAANHRPLNLADLSFAWQLDEDRAAEIARPLLSDLKALAAPAGRDDAGIPYRGGEILRETVEGAAITELAALYVTLFRQSAGTVVLDAIIFACGTQDTEK